MTPVTAATAGVERAQAELLARRFLAQPGIELVSPKGAELGKRENWTAMQRWLAFQEISRIIRPLIRESER